MRTLHLINACCVDITRDMGKWQKLLEGFWSLPHSCSVIKQCTLQLKQLKWPPSGKCWWVNKTKQHAEHACVTYTVLYRRWQFANCQYPHKDDEITLSSFSVHLLMFTAVRHVCAPMWITSMDARVHFITLPVFFFLIWRHQYSSSSGFPTSTTSV